MDNLLSRVFRRFKRLTSSFKKLSVLSYVALSFLFGLSNLSAQEAAQIIQDGFEQKISSFWLLNKIEQDSILIQNQYVKSGKTSLRIQLFPGEKKDTGSDGEATERAELQEGKEIFLPLGTEAKYNISFFLPPDFPIVDRRLVIMQWKQLCANCFLKRSPILAERYRNGKLYITVNRAEGQQTIFEETSDIRGQWIDMAYQVRFSANPNQGFVKIWKNGVLVAEYKGALGYEDDRPFTYFKFGLYRDSLAIPMVIYFDDFRREIISTTP